MHEASTLLPLGQVSLAPTSSSPKAQGYNADTIVVLEGLEPVRCHPGMYIGGTDSRAMHHLIREVLDNAMDEVVARHAERIEVHLSADNAVTIRDNGRGIPVDPHPKYPEKSALEVILTTLHAGSKFASNQSKAYQTAGGLHGVGVSVVNALSSWLEVEVVRDQRGWKQRYERGVAMGPVESMATLRHRRGTLVRFCPDPLIFGDLLFDPREIYALLRSKAYLYPSVTIAWSCDEALLTESMGVPRSEQLHFPGGLHDYMVDRMEGSVPVIAESFEGRVPFPDGMGECQWALHWTDHHEVRLLSFCNTIPTPQGGSHELAFRQLWVKTMRKFGEMAGCKRVQQWTVDDIMAGMVGVISLFIPTPQFQGQTKDKLLNPEVIRWVEMAVRPPLEAWLARSTSSQRLLEMIGERCEERLAQKKTKEVVRKAIGQRLRLPGKLVDCSREGSEATEIFLLEGDSAAGSAKKARQRETQAIFPLRGKILNVASHSWSKIRQNQELMDLEVALGCGSRDRYVHQDLRYEKVIIMTDADVDGAHIASLLMTYFLIEMPELVCRGHLYLATPPLYRLSHQQQTVYVRSDAEKEAWMRGKRGGVSVSRFKGLGEMSAEQLRETTMDPSKRSLIRVRVDTDDLVVLQGALEKLMGRHPEWRSEWIQAQSALYYRALETDGWLDV